MGDQTETFRIPMRDGSNNNNNRVGPAASSTAGDGPVNPWSHRLNLRWWHYPQIAAMSLTLAPLRMAATLTGELQSYNVMHRPVHEMRTQI